MFFFREVYIVLISVEMAFQKGRKRKSKTIGRRHKQSLSFNTLRDSQAAVPETEPGFVEGGPDAVQAEPEPADRPPVKNPGADAAWRADRGIVEREAKIAKLKKEVAETHMRAQNTTLSAKKRIDKVEIECKSSIREKRKQAARVL